MERVLYYFNEICAIPHGSGNMDAISRYCLNFAEEKGFWCHRDDANNVIIKKEATPDRACEEPIILQGHLDMVCQKDKEREIDFEKEGITTFIEGDFLKAHGTTLGGDDGIAVAMILAILSRSDLSHPPIEALFTTDEEVGMVGAGKVDFSLLSGKRMVNLDSEQEDVITVACAGGRDVTFRIPGDFSLQKGDLARISFSGLLGGHSGVDIHKKRDNAICLMARFLSAVAEETEISLVSLTGGEKANVIPSESSALVMVPDGESFISLATERLLMLKEEISDGEKDFAFSLSVIEKNTEKEGTKKENTLAFLTSLALFPSGVVEMNEKVFGMVQSSLNLGIFKTEKEGFFAHFLLRSDREESLSDMENLLQFFAENCGATTETFGHYPPWEYQENSALRTLYAKLYQEEMEKEIGIESIHAGLECGVFAAHIPSFDCIAIGPDLYDIHTTKERLSLSSAERVYKRVCKLLLLA